MPLELPYGTWPSPLSARDVTASSPRIDGARFVGDDVWWGESLPHEGGRAGVLRVNPDGDGEPSIVLPAPWSARSRVHEYGGGAWTVTDDGDLVFVEASDQRIYRLTPGAEPQPLTPADDTQRFGDLRVAHGAVWAVRERTTGSPAHDVVRVPLDGSAAADATAIVSVTAGSDFVASPSPSPDGTLIAWIAWNHPDMPWDATELRVATIGADGVAGAAHTVAGGSAVSALQPEWTADRELVFAADGSGRWNLTRSRVDDSGAPITATALAPSDTDTGGPLWNLGARWFLPLTDGRILAIRTQGRDSLALIDSAEGDVTMLDVPVSAATLLRDALGSRVLLTGSGERVPAGLWLLDIDGGGAIRPLRGGVAALDEAWLPHAREIQAEGPDGPVYAFAYPPTNPGVVAPEGELAPYIVLAHGGPTAHVAGDASPAIAFFTSRGIGVLDVNYGGSTGYGREYRERLDGQWGIVDVRDVAAAARALADAGGADPDRLAIKGSSAGGWTVLCALADTDVVAAGISRYGVADLEALAAETHDFESRYLDRLVGPLPADRDVYVARSPLSRPETLTAPVLILQGSEDPVVPPSQAEALRDALAGNGVRHAYVLYEGESHGFRREQTIVHALESELSFLGQVMGFATPGVPTLPLD